MRFKKRRSRGRPTVATLRHEDVGDDHRYLSVRFTDDGSLLIEGQDLGPTVEAAWGQGNTEYEWLKTVPAADVPRLLELLGIDAAVDALSELEARYRDQASDEFERIVRESGLATTDFTRAGP